MADFVGGLKSRQISAFSVLMISSSFGLGTLLIAVWVRGVPLSSNPVLLWAVLGGMAGAIAGAVLAARENANNGKGNRLATGVGLAIGGVALISAGNF